MRKWRVSLCFIFAVLLLAGSSFVRFRGLKENGIVGSDTFQYWDIAFSWNQGDFVLNNDLKEYRQYFRPTFYALNCLSLKLFGARDYALKEMIGIFETINVALVLLLGLVYFRGKFLAAFALALAYAATSSTILQSQIELPHTYSVTFVLAMFLCFLIAHRRAEASSGIWPRSWILASGIFAGCAATTHGSTTFLGPTMVALLVMGILWNKQGGWKRNWKTTVAPAGIFSGGFALPYAFWGAVVGYPYMLRALNSERTIRDSADLNPITLFWKWFTEGPKESLSTLTLLLFLASIVYLGWLLWLRKSSLRLLSPPFVVVSFCVLFSLVFQNVFYERLFLPLNAFVLLTIFAAAFDFASRIHERFAPAMMLLLAIPIGYANMKTDYGSILAHARGERRGGPRTVFNEIGGLVKDDAKLLITPYIQYFHRPQYKAAVYFGTNALYLMECGQGTLREFVEKNKVKFVLISKDIDKRILGKPHDFYKNIGACEGMSFATYDLDKDIAAVRSFLDESGATPMKLSSETGELFALP